MLATALPVWMLAAVAAISSVAALIGSLSSAVMAWVNVRKLETMHQTLKRIDTQTKGPA
jgi:hypothetical protein